MPVVGLVVTLRDDPEACGALMDWIDQDPRFTAGVPHGRRLPLVMDTPDAGADRDAWDELIARPGVVHADIVFAALSEPTPADLNTPAEMVTP